MDAEALQAVLERCVVSRSHSNRMKELFSARPAPSLRADFARCAIGLALEHHSALVRVVEAGEYGTGGALLRPILEAATTGYWFVYVASCAEITKLPTAPVDIPEADTPQLKPMVESLIPIFPSIQRMSDALKKGGAAKWLHKYTHGSTPQLTRRGAGGWSEGDVILTLIRADMFAVLAACLQTVIVPDSELEDYAFSLRDELGLELQMKFNVEPISQQPRGLPKAPLLSEGCGGPISSDAQA